MQVMIEASRKLEVYKPAETIRIKDKLSRTASITALVFIREMFNAPADQKEYPITVTQLYQALGYQGRNYSYIKAVIHELLTSLIEWDVVEDGERSRWKSSAWCSYASLEDGVISFSFSDQLKQILKNASKIWHATISLPIIARLNSRYAVKLYELCKLYFIEHRVSSQTPSWTLSKWREYFGVEQCKAYLEFKRFTARVITPAITEINDKTDIFVQPVFKREMRKVVAIYFTIKRNPQYESIKVENKLEVQTKANDNPIVKMPQVLRDRVRKTREERAADIRTQEPVRQLGDLLGKWRQ